MSQPTLPSIETVSSLPETDQKLVLDLLFEPHPTMHTTFLPTLRSTAHTSYADLIAACQTQLKTLAASSPREPTLLDILGSHPRLGERRKLSASSEAEQARLRGALEQLARMNGRYEEAFPGLRYIVFVNGRGDEEILADAEARIQRGDFAAEVETAMKVRCAAPVPS
jgi:2-oxo-4-hydroxy-4-carboxy--5-ureidoimidazoline (OHCU) decarboxylase